MPERGKEDKMRGGVCRRGVKKMARNAGGGGGWRLKKLGEGVTQKKSKGGSVENYVFFRGVKYFKME